MEVMNREEEIKPRKLKMPKQSSGGGSVLDMNTELETKRVDPILPVTPRSGAVPKVMKSSSARFNCLCSPTTHAGSFRCRHHRLSAMTRSGSIGSNLSLLSSKSGRYSDSLQAQ